MHVNLDIHAIDTNMDIPNIPWDLAYNHTEWIMEKELNILCDYNGNYEEQSCKTTNCTAPKTRNFQPDLLGVRYQHNCTGIYLK